MNRTTLARMAAILSLAAAMSATGNGLAQARTSDSAATVEMRLGGIQAPAASLIDQIATQATSETESFYYENSSTSTYSSQAADDFVVPVDTFWQISTVTVSGFIEGSLGTIDSLLIQFYSNSGGGLPETRLFSTTVSSGSIGGLGTGLFVVTLSPPTVLGTGHYWMSAQAGRCATLPCKVWHWHESTGQILNESVWQNPGQGFGPDCPAWQLRVTTCNRPSDSQGKDLAFKLEGTVVPVTNHIFLPRVQR